MTVKYSLETFLGSGDMDEIFSEEAYKFFLEAYETYTADYQDRNLEEIIASVYTHNWFEKNKSFFDVLGRRCHGVHPTELVITSSVRRGKEGLFRFFKSLSSIIDNQALAFDQSDFKRLADPHRSSECYFELRILNLLSQSGFSIERDFKTYKNKDVDALIARDEWSTLIDCKWLNISQASAYFYELLEQFEAYLLTCRLEKGLSICGNLVFKRHFGSSGWHNIFEMTKASVTEGVPYKCECDDFEYEVVPAPNAEHQTFKTSEPMPTNRRIKETLNKMLLKLKGTDGGTLICCIPPEAGQASAHWTIMELLCNNRFRKIDKVITVDVRDTFEDEYLVFDGFKNPNCNKPTLDWDSADRCFHVID